MAMTDLDVAGVRADPPGRGAAMVPSSCGRWLGGFILTCLLALAAVPAVADEDKDEDKPNHYIVLFDASGSVVKEHRDPHDFWGGTVGDTAAMAARLQRLIHKVFTEMPESFPPYRPDKDVFSFMLFNVDPYNPVFTSDRMFLTNNQLLEVTGPLPQARDYQRFDDHARTGIEGHTIELKDVFKGHSPLIAATGVSLPFLSNALRAAGPGVWDQDRVIANTYLIRITDGMFNSESNGSDEHDVIIKTARQQRDKERVPPSGLDDGFDAHQAQAERVNQVFDIGAKTVTCAFPTNNRPDTFGLPLDCSEGSYHKVAGWGLGFLIKYMKVEPKVPGLAGLARTEKARVELDTVYRYPDASIHLTGINPVFAASATHPDGLYRLIPKAVEWREATSDWQKCAAPDPATGTVDCGAAGPRLDFREGQVPEALSFRVSYTMQFPLDKDGLMLYPYPRALEPLSLTPVALAAAPILDMVHELPRDPDHFTLEGLNPLRLWPGPPPAFHEQPIDAQALKAKAVEWRDEIRERMQDWVKDWKLPDADGVVPRMIARVSADKKDRIEEQEASLNTTAFEFWLVAGTVGLGFYFLWPRRKLFARLIGQAGGAFVLDFNEPRPEYNLLVGMVRIENLGQNPLLHRFGFAYGFSNLKARLLREATLANEGNDPEALRFEERDGAPLALGTPGSNLLVERQTAHGREFAVFFNPADVRDLNQDVGAAKADFRIPVVIRVSADKLHASPVTLELPLSIRPEQGRLGITCIDDVPLQIQEDEKKSPPVRIAEWRGDERAALLCTYQLRNTAQHRYSQPVKGEIGIHVVDHEGKPLDKSIVRLVKGDREGDRFDYNLRRGEDDKPEITTLKVVVDFTKLDNPFSAADFLVRIRYHDGICAAPDLRTPAGDSETVDDLDDWESLDGRLGEWLLRVARSTERTDCSLVIVETEQRRSEPLNRARPTLSAPYVLGTPEHPRPAQYQAQDPLNRMRLCRLHLANACRNGHGHADWKAGLMLVSADGIKLKQGGLRLLDTHGKALDRGTLRDSLDESQREQDLAVVLDLKDVDFLTRDARLRIEILVDWTAHPEGAADPGQDYSFRTLASLSCCLRHEPPDDVLAVDFGTSALAVAHAVGPTGVQLLPLPQRLPVIENASDGRILRRRLDDPEPSRNRLFLASEFNVCLDDAKLAQTEPDDPAFIDLPLMVPATYEHPDKCFSSLKALISAGFLTLPLDVKEHPYQYEGRLQSEMPPPLGAVIAGAYRGLLRNFIEPLLIAMGRRGYSHVYITHPNTYTPNHVRQLRSIVEDVFGGIAVGRNVVYPDNIHFFSESDAVAYYFLIHAHRLRRPGAVVPECERILVYDIGAGTLDMTYLEVDWEPNQADGFTPTRIRVRRRGGVAKAGDLLDECIARDLHAYLDRALDAKRYLTPIVVSTEGERMETGTVRRMDKLRQQIHQIKIELSGGAAVPSLELSSTQMDGAVLILTAGDDTPALYADCTELRATPRGQVFWEPGRERLLNGEYVSAFVEQVTRTEVQRFFGNEIPNLDTVILSGRTSLWPGFQDRLRATLGSVPNWVDFGADADTLKKVVVEGVIEREFRWRHVEFEAPEVVGRFGVRYERAHKDDWHFEPYEKSGDQKEFYLHDASEVQIGLLTNNGFHRCHSLLPHRYYDPGDLKLTIRLDFDASGYLQAEVVNTRGDTWSFSDTTSPPTLDFNRHPWPLGAAKLHAMTPQKLLGGEHPEVWS